MSRGGDLPAGDPAAWWRRLHLRPVTATLGGLCLLAHVATMAAVLSSTDEIVNTAVTSIWSLAGHEDLLIRLGALELTHVWRAGEWWRVVTTGLLHGSLLHLGLNLWALGSIGDWSELAWGRWKHAAIFAVSSIAGCLASLLWCEARIVVGASAGILGWAGALWVARRFGSNSLQTQLEPVSSFALGLLILVCLGLGAVIPGIAQAGHVGGLAAGAILGATLVQPRWPLRALGATLLATLLATTTLLARAPIWKEQYHSFIGFALSSEEDYSAAISYFEEALKLSDDRADLLNSIAYQFALDGVELDRAEVYILEALTLEPANANFLDTLGWVWCRQGKAVAAENMLRAAAILSGSDNEEILTHIVECPNAAVAVDEE